MITAWKAVYLLYRSEKKCTIVRTASKNHSKSLMVTKNGEVNKNLTLNAGGKARLFPSVYFPCEYIVILTHSVQIINQKT